MPRYEVLSEESMAVLEEGWRAIVRDIGIEFQWEPALELFRKAGQTVEGELVKLDPDFVLEQVARAPAELGLSARNPARSRRLGGDTMLFCRHKIYPLGLPNGLSHVLAGMALFVRLILKLKSGFLPPPPQQR